MKKVIVITQLLLSSIFLSAEEIEITYTKYIGAGIGMTTGGGLTYRYWPENWGGQVLFTPMWNDYEIGFNLGLAGFRTLHETKYTRLFLYLATNAYMEWGEEDIADYVDADGKELENVEPEMEDSMSIEPAVGFGPGLEIYLFEHIVIDVMFGFGLTNNGLNFTAETGLYYRF